MLIEQLGPDQRIISITGMAKNCGKTVTLNRLLEEAGESGKIVGLTSIGRDGESVDIVTDTEKPKIYAERGTLLATAEQTLMLGDAEQEILATTGYRSPMGNIVLARVREAGYVQIAGPQLLSELKQVSWTMVDRGADFSVIDGAIDRLSQAAPSISDATILASGAVLSRDMNRVIESTVHTVHLFGLERTTAPESVLKSMEACFEAGSVAVIGEGGEVEVVPVKTALQTGHILGDRLKKSSRYIVIPGSLTGSTLRTLTETSRHYREVEIVVRDGTKIFVEPREWRILMRQGVRVSVWHRIRLLALTLNPYAPEGYSFPPNEFLERMRTYLPEVPVWDLML